MEERRPVAKGIWGMPWRRDSWPTLAPQRVEAGEPVDEVSLDAGFLSSGKEDRVRDRRGPLDPFTGGGGSKAGGI